ncbi:MAG: helix-turn-helix domain-containing protein [Actinomycetota bacterium]
MPTKTAAQRRTAAKHEYDAFMATCPTRQLLDVISDKWLCLVMTSLSQGRRRHSDLAREICGVSQKMLTQTLRSMERDGLVVRTVTPSVPVRVDYELSELGCELAPLMRAVKSWAEQHMDRVLTARGAHDRTQARMARAAAS